MCDSNPKRLTFQIIHTKYMSNLLKGCEINRTAGIDNVSGR